MAINRVSSFFDGFNQGYSTVNRILKDKQIREIAEAVPEQSQGFTADQGDQLRAAAESGQYDIGYDDAKKGYTITPKADPTQTGVIAQQGVTDFMGSRTAGAMSEGQVNSARNRAMAGVMKKFGDVEGGMRMEQQARAGERDDLRFEREQKRWGKEDEADAKLKEYEEGRKSLFSQSRFGMIQSEHQKAMADYQKKLDEYESAKASGKTGPALGVPPVAPSRPEYSVGDALADRSALIDHDAKYGKLDTKAFGEFTDMLNKVQSEGYEKALRMAQSGAGLSEIAQAFNAGGQQKFDPASVVSDKMVKGRDGVETRVIQYKDQAGNVRTLNTVAELDALGKASDVFTRHYQAKSDQRADAQLQLARNADARAGASVSRGKAEKSAHADAAVQLFKERNPNATAAEVNAVRNGILSATPEKGGAYKTESGDVTSLLGTPAVDESGKPLIDPMTGRQVVNRNPGKELELFKFMQDNGIRDTNEGLQKFLTRGPGGGGGRPGRTVAKGQVVDGYEFLGGDPKNPKNWRQVSSGAAR